MPPRNLQPSALALVVVPAVVSTLLVGVRIWRRHVTKKFAIEDVLLVIAQVLIIVLTYTTWQSYKKSWYGYHYYDIPPGAVDPPTFQKWGFANAIVYNPILGLIKASFVITLLKLRSPNRRINIALWTIFTINGLFTIAAPLVCAFQCSPVSRFWDKTIPGKCLDAAKYTYGTISIVLITDVAVVGMPTWILHSLHMPLRRKGMYIAFLSFGVAVTAIGGYRLYVFVQLFGSKRMNPDASYGIRQGLSNVEVSLASIGACGATVKWLLGQCVPFFRDADTPRLSKYNATQSSGDEVDMTAERLPPARSADWSWRSREMGSNRTADSTLVSREREVGVPPPIVWKKVKTRNRPTRKERQENVQTPAGLRTEDLGRLGTSTTHASSSKEARPRDGV
ncbi:hypothetical protein K458DRAFT_45393 [Lentithecium fluviatile CBS 122367]|uniref:Rhodopsin domain-containing protein n=1 Tax=Lentithecium fluviatile CBS 122367 TaxID=1168545 RepID=A0A6G1IZQ6_9PLEO|nr:hypothetical protein K458DRAFT_45393 [Lentithecium fluviatile CBS 122367]